MKPTPCLYTHMFTPTPKHRYVYLSIPDVIHRYANTCMFTYHHTKCSHMQLSMKQIIVPAM